MKNSLIPCAAADEPREIVGLVVGRRDLGECRQYVTQVLQFELAPVAGDVVDRCEPLDAGQARPRRRPDRIHQIDVGDARPFLQFGQDLEVDMVKLRRQWLSGPCSANSAAPWALAALPNSDLSRRSADRAPDFQLIQHLVQCFSQARQQQFHLCRRARQRRGPEPIVPSAKARKTMPLSMPCWNSRSDILRAGSKAALVVLFRTVSTAPSMPLARVSPTSG